MNDDDYVVFTGWMRNILKLSGNELLVYAIVYSFSRDGVSKFQGSIKYLEESTGASEKTVRRTLDSLVERNLLKKEILEIGNVRFNHYKANLEMLRDSDDQGVVKMTRGGGQNDQQIIQEYITPLGESIYSDKSSYISSPVPPEGELEKKPSKKFSKPSVEEVANYCKERSNSVDPQSFVDFYESKGWVVGKSPMKDWKAAVRTWERSHGDSAKPAIQTTTQEDKPRYKPKTLKYLGEIETCEKLLKEAKAQGNEKEIKLQQWRLDGAKKGFYESRMDVLANGETDFNDLRMFSQEEKAEIRKLFGLKSPEELKKERERKTKDGIDRISMEVFERIRRRNNGSNQ